MADKMKDAEDRLLESMFQSPPVTDDGFSRQVLGRIRRQIWVRRLALPVAILIGGAIALKPVMQLIGIGLELSAGMPAAWVPKSVLASDLPMIITIGMATAAAMLTFRMLEE